MLITKEQQEALINNYAKENHSQDECLGFIDGVEKAMELVEKFSIDKSIHHFKPSKDDINFCTCGKYLTDFCHIRGEV